MPTKKQSAAAHPRDRSRRPAKSSRTVPPLLRTFAQALEVMDRQPTTINSYLNAVHLFAQWLSNHHHRTYVTLADLVRAITPMDLRQFQTYLVQTKHATPRSANQRLMILGVLTEWARRRGYIVHDPAEGLSPLTTEVTTPRWLSPTEQTALERAAEQDGNVRNWAILLLMLQAGLQVSEVVALRLEDVTLSERNSEVTVRGKSVRARMIPLDRTATQPLRAYLDQRPRTTEAAFFLGPQGQPLGIQGIEYQLRVLTRLAGLTDVSAQTLRRTYVHNLVIAGQPVAEIARLAGYRSLASLAPYLQEPPGEQ